MRLGIVADIHCNAAGLEMALARMGDVDELLCAGDAVYQYRFSNEVVELLKQREARMILGNHEDVLLGDGGARAREAPHVRQDYVEYLRSQPYQVEVEVSGRRLLMVHASPFPPYNHYVYPGTREMDRLAEIDADYIILGHTHVQMAVPSGRVLVINPGSAGDPRDHRNGYALSYAILDSASGEVTFDNFPRPAIEPPTS